MPSLSITGMIAQKAADLDLNAGIPGKFAGRIINLFTAPAACVDSIANLVEAVFKAPFSPFVSVFNGIQWLRNKQMCTPFSVSDVLKNLIKAVEHVFYIVVGPVIGVVSPQTLRNRFFKVAIKGPVSQEKNLKKENSLLLQLKEVVAEQNQSAGIASSMAFKPLEIKQDVEKDLSKKESEDGSTGRLTALVPDEKIILLKSADNMDSSIEMSSGSVTEETSEDSMEVIQSEESKQAEELAKQQAMEAEATQKAELEAQAEAKRLEDLAKEAKRQGDLAKEAEARLKAGQEAQAEAKRQAELAKEAEIRRKAELEAQAEAKRQADLVKEAERKAAEAIQQQKIAKQSEKDTKIQAVETEKEKIFVAIENDRKTEVKKLEKKKTTKIEEAFVSKEMRLDDVKEDAEKSELNRMFEKISEEITSKTKLKIEEINRNALSKRGEASRKADASISQITREYR